MIYAGLAYCLWSCSFHWNRLLTPLLNWTKKTSSDSAQPGQITLLSLIGENSHFCAKEKWQMRSQMRREMAFVTEQNRTERRYNGSSTHWAELLRSHEVFVCTDLLCCISLTESRLVCCFSYWGNFLLVMLCGNVLEKAGLIWKISDLIQKVWR